MTSTEEPVANTRKRKRYDNDNDGVGQEGSRQELLVLQQEEDDENMINKLADGMLHTFDRQVKDQDRYGLFDKVVARLQGTARQRKRAMLESGSVKAQIVIKKGQYMLEFPITIFGLIASFCDSRMSQNNFGATCVAAQWAVRNSINTALQWPSKCPVQLDATINEQVHSFSSHNNVSKITFVVTGKGESGVRLRLETWDRLNGHESSRVCPREILPQEDGSVYSTLVYPHGIFFTMIMNKGENRGEVWDMIQMIRVGTLSELFQPSDSVASFEDFGVVIDHGIVDDTTLLIFSGDFASRENVHVCRMSRDTSGKIVSYQPLKSVTLGALNTTSHSRHLFRLSDALLSIDMGSQQVSIRDLENNTLTVIPKISVGEYCHDAVAYWTAGKKWVFSGPYGLAACDVSGDAYEDFGPMYLLEDWQDAHYDTLVFSSFDPDVVGGKRHGSGKWQIFNIRTKAVLHEQLPGQEWTNFMWRFAACPQWSRSSY